MEKIDNGSECDRSHSVLFKKDLMIGALYDKRLTAITRMARFGANSTVAVVHAVINNPLFFRLNQQDRESILCGVRKDVLPRQNPFPQ